jgi:hypothetical protein
MGKDFNLGGVVDPTVDTEVEHGEALLAYADAIYENDSIAVMEKREQVLKKIGPSGLVEAAATAANFSMLDRIANAAGIQIEAIAVGQTEDFRAELGINDYVSAANTLGS